MSLLAGASDELAAVVDVEVESRLGLLLFCIRRRVEGGERAFDEASSSSLIQRCFLPLEDARCVPPTPGEGVDDEADPEGVDGPAAPPNRSRVRHAKSSN